MLVWTESVLKQIYPDECGCSLTSSIFRQIVMSTHRKHDYFPFSANVMMDVSYESLVWCSAVAAPSSSLLPGQCRYCHFLTAWPPSPPPYCSKWHPHLIKDTFVVTLMAWSAIVLWSA